MFLIKNKLNIINVQNLIKLSEIVGEYIYIYIIQRLLGILNI